MPSDTSITRPASPAEAASAVRKNGGQHLRDLAMLIVLALLVFLPGLARIPAIDRDEARYAQATVQMLETGDYVDIRFQDDPRWKKPAGAYWAQAVSVSLFSSPEARVIWAHRIPSVLGALLMVLMTYLGGRRLVGKQAAFIGAALLAVSLALIYEAHAAKTDALLAGFTALSFAALAHLRTQTLRPKLWALLFWAGVGLGIMMKGPISPLVIILCLLTLFAWERQGQWLKPLIFPLGPLLVLAIVLPWMVLIYQKTGGAFFSTAVGEDLAPKLAGGAESHGAWPGYYLLTIWLMFFPGIAYLIPGLSFAITALRRTKGNATAKNTPIPRALRLLLCWALPWWIVVELMPTKLPHYTLPIYPALALLAGLAAATLMQVDEFKISRRLSAVLFTLFGLLLLFGGMAALAYYGPQPSWQFAAAVVIVLLLCASFVLLWNAKRAAPLLTIITGVALWIFAFGAILPSLDRLTVSNEVNKVLTSEGISTPLSLATQLYSPHFSEPSLVFAHGTHIKIGMDKGQPDLHALNIGDIVITDQSRLEGTRLIEQISQMAAIHQACFTLLGDVAGENYSKGDSVNLRIMRKAPCPPNSDALNPVGPNAETDNPPVE